MKSPWNPMFAGCLRDGTHVCWLFEGWNLQFCGQGSVALDLDKSQPRVVRCSAVQTESMAHRYGVSPCLTHLWLEKTHLWSETQHDPTKNTSHQKGQRSKQRGIAYCCKDDDHQLRSFGVVAGFGGGTRTTGAAQDEGRPWGWVWGTSPMATAASCSYIPRIFVRGIFSRLNLFFLTYLWDIGTHRVRMTY